MNNFNQFSDYNIEYYVYSNETDKYICDYNFANLFKTYNELEGAKHLGFIVMDRDGCTMADEILFKEEAKQCK